MIPDDWKKLQVPLGFLVGVVAAFALLWGWAKAELAWAEDVKAHIQEIRKESDAKIQVIQMGQIQMEVRTIERDKRKIELEITRLQSKKRYSPEKFDNVDKDTLEQLEKDNQALKEDIKEVKTRGATANVSSSAATPALGPR